MGVSCGPVVFLVSIRVSVAWEIQGLLGVAFGAGRCLVAASVMAVVML